MFSGKETDAVIREKTIEMLQMLDQAHIVQYLNGLDPAAQTALLRHIDSLDFSIFDACVTEQQRGAFSPLPAVTIKEIDKCRSRYTETGIRAIQEGKVGAVLLAGGQGSRLGFAHPKGMYNIGETRALFIFECLMRNLQEVTDAAGAYVPLFVMTSPENNQETREFFEQHSYFGYSPDNIWFFVQEQLPVLDPNGKLMLSGKSRICTAPNGNGGWYASMDRTGMLQVIRSSNIEWLNVFAVDNVLQRMADPCFIGAVIESGMTSGAKAVAKAAPDEKVGVLCLEDGKPSIVEYYEMTEEMLTRREPDGTLSYNYGVILNYLFRVDQLETTLNVKLPLHRAFKKVKYMAPDGTVIRPETPNAYKFETLALDMVKLQRDCLVYEVDRVKEFAPVKNSEGVDSVETARALLRKNGIVL